MRTGSTDLGKGQEAPQQDPHFINAVQHTTASSPDNLSRPPQRPSGKKRALWFGAIAAILVLAIISGVSLFLLAQEARHPGAQPTPTPQPSSSVTPTPGSGDTIPSPTPGIAQGPQQGPASVSDPAYWNRILGIQSGKVERVIFAHIEGKSTLQALVSVRRYDAQRTLDLYVFDNITSTRPTQVFEMQGLINGDTTISMDSTVLVAEVDQNSTLNAGKTSQQWTQDLFREFAWKQQKGTLIQTAFPGLFPDLTRYQAEADQARVNQGQDPWKNDPAQVASRLAAQFLQWERPLTTSIVKGGGASDVNATVTVSETPIQGTQFSPSITVTLSRLEGNIHNMWVAIAVSSQRNLTVENIEARSQVGSPVKIEGSGSTFEGVIGRALVLDHLYNTIGHAQVTGTPGMGLATYTTLVLYNTSFHNGAQEGIVEVQADNGGISDETSSAVLIKVLLTPA